MTKTLESLPTYSLYEADADTANQAEIEQRTITADQLRDEHKKLYDQYRNRELGRTVLFGAQMFEDSVIATRFFDQRGIEEVWQVSDDYSHKYKNGARRNISVKLFDDDGQSARLLIRENDSLQLDLREVNGAQVGWRRGSESEVQEVAFDIMHRSSDARSKNQERQPHERQWADQHAKTLLGEKYPDLLAKKAPIE